MTDGLPPNVVSIVQATINRLAPLNVDRDAITVTGEGAAVKLVLVPHRDLGGTALVIWADRRGIELRWAQVGDLSYHDDIDLGVRTGRIDWGGEWEAKLASLLAAELLRPIKLRYKRRLLGKPVVECWLDVGGRPKRIAIVRPRGGLPNDPYGAQKRLETALGAGHPLPFSAPPPLAEWRKNA
jgi:hypothetical protein